MGVFVAGATGAIGRYLLSALIVHQPTDLIRLRNFRSFDREFAVTNELRAKGTDYLLEAAAAAATRRFIARSFIGAVAALPVFVSRRQAPHARTGLPGRLPDVGPRGSS